MIVSLKGDILSSKFSDKNKSPYVVVSQINDAGFQELVKITTDRIYKRGDVFDELVNLKALKTSDNRVMLRGWVINGNNKS